MMLKNLKSLRAELGLSQRELANAIGTSQQSINRYENTKGEPDICTLILLARFFHTSVDYLVGNSTQRYRTESAGCRGLDAEDPLLFCVLGQMSPNQRDALKKFLLLFFAPVPKR